MVKVVVCIKRSPDVNELKVDPATGVPILREVPYKISDFDKNALEEAVRLKERHGGQVVIVSAGPPEVKTVVKEALAMGGDEAFLLVDEAFGKLDPLLTANILASGLKKVGGWDLIICGEGSVDEYNAQVGPRLAEALNIPHIAYVTKVGLRDHAIVVERTLEDRVEVVEAVLPVLMTVGMEINEPRYPTLIQLMQASKKKVTELTPSDLGLQREQVEDGAMGIKIESMRAPKSERKKVRIEAPPEEAAAKLLAVLVEESILNA